MRTRKRHDEYWRVEEGVAESGRARKKGAFHLSIGSNTYPTCTNTNKLFQYKTSFIQVNKLYIIHIYTYINIKEEIARKRQKVVGIKSKR